MQSLPQNFVSLDEASKTFDKNLNIIGMVSDFLPPSAPFGRQQGK